jgi:hypothetical protein
MTITLDDGQKVQVKICDEHAEDATVKSAKKAYSDRMSKLKELLEQAKALGFDLGAMQPAQQPAAKPVAQVRQQVPAPMVKEQALIELDDSENVVDTDLIDRGRPFVSSGGNTEYGPVQSFTNYNLDGGTDKLPPEARKGKAHMAMMEGRAGQPIIIPDKRVDGTGTTTIKIIKAESDATLQNRFKKMASDSMHDKVPDFVHGGYSAGVKDCPFCRGQGNIKNGQKMLDCPKCHGSGILPA